MTMISTAKLVSMAIIFALSCISGFIPILALRWTSSAAISSKISKLILSIVTCFSGGVFFATSMLNLLPAAKDAMVDAFELLHWDSDYPLTETLIGVGFMLVLFIESIALSCCSTYSEVDKSHSPDTSEDKATTELRDMDKLKIPTGIPTISQDVISATIGELVIDETATDLSGTSSFDTSIDDSTTIESEGLPKLRTIILMVALSIHMIFDGLAIGLLDTDNEVWSILLPICIHKLLVFFSLGLAVYEILTSLCQSVVALILLSLVSPIGISIGIALTANGTGVIETTTSAFLQGIAVGTFMYVTFFEILQREFSTHTKHRILQAFSTMLGYAVMAVLKYILPE